ncbi:MAG TPA: T9SS type A sorting domain-containing protein, partial [Bacteroidetes bacterium]|nr:T9SS type A sorting domain-containing protein [Bacteroidota bacterium]
VVTYLHETKEIEIKLWPNPVGSQLNLQYDKPVKELKLYDQLMREIRPYWNNNGSFYTIDMNGLRRGIYHLRINGMNVKHRFLKL